MRELAKKAGVSPATPYNLLSNKANLLALVVQDEFQDFQAKLGALRHLDAFDRLFGAVDLYPRIMALIENSISDFFGLLRMVPRVRWLNWFQERDGPFFTTCWNLPFWNIAKNRWSTPE